MKPFYRFAHIIVRAFLKCLYRLKVYGLENVQSSGAIIASSHVSFYDPPIIAASWPQELHFLAREPLFHVPVLSFLIRHLNSHPVSGDQTDIKSFRTLCNLINSGKQVVIFPEGERSYDGEILPMKNGVAMLALRCDAPIVPTYIHGAFEVWDRMKSLPKPWGHFTCVFGTPISPKSFASMPKKEAQLALSKKMGESIAALKKWVEEGSKGTPP